MKYHQWTVDTKDAKYEPEGYMNLNSKKLVCVNSSGVSMIGSFVKVSQTGGKVKLTIRDLVDSVHIICCDDKLDIYYTDKPSWYKKFLPVPLDIRKLISDKLAKTLTRYVAKDREPHFYDVHHEGSSSPRFIDDCTPMRIRRLSGEDLPMKVHSDESFVGKQFYENSKLVLYGSNLEMKALPKGTVYYEVSFAGINRSIILTDNGNLYIPFRGRVSTSTGTIKLLYSDDKDLEEFSYDGYNFRSALLRGTSEVFLYVMVKPSLRAPLAKIYRFLSSYDIVSADPFYCDRYSVILNRDKVGNVISQDPDEIDVIWEDDLYVYPLHSWVNGYNFWGDFICVSPDLYKLKFDKYTCVEPIAIDSKAEETIEFIDDYTFTAESCKYLMERGNLSTNEKYLDLDTWYPSTDGNYFLVKRRKGTDSLVSIYHTYLSTVKSWEGEVLYYIAELKYLATKANHAFRKFLCKSVNKSDVDKAIENFIKTEEFPDSESALLIKGLEFTKSKNWGISEIEDRADRVLVRYRQIGGIFYDFTYLKGKKKLVQTSSPKGNPVLDKYLIKFLSKKYKTLMSTRSLRFVVYVYNGSDIVLDEKHLADYSTSLEDCKEICKHRKETHFLVLEFTGESIKHQYEIRKATRGSLKTTKLV